MRERSDVVRNRQRILDAAARIFVDAPDPRAVTMEDLARGAGVGRATLYRHFDSVGTVANALLDQHEKDLQGRLLSGPPPLGPGAAPAQRLAAFYDAMVTLIEEHSALVLGAETGRARFDVGAYGFWRAHVLALIRDARVTDDGTVRDTLADTLLAPLDPSLYRHLRQRGTTPSDIRVALHILAQRTLG